MIVTMQKDSAEPNIEAVRAMIRRMGFHESRVIRGDDFLVIGAVGKPSGVVDLDAVSAMPSVVSVARVSAPYKLVCKRPDKQSSKIRLNGHTIGGSKFVVMAGPCSVESQGQIVDTAKNLVALGASVLRGGLSKPRTSPYDFQGHKAEGVEWVKEAKAETGLAFITEVMDPEDIYVYADCADVYQLGARNMQNHRLLQALGKCNKPVLIKRGLSCTIDEMLMAAEYVCAGGNLNVILCPRGIRTFETATRNTADIDAIAVLKEKTHLPVIFDPSHATGKRSLVLQLAFAAMAAGADGLLVEVHHDPSNAMSDGAQSLNFEQFAELMQGVDDLEPFWTSRYRR